MFDKKDRAIIKAAALAGYAQSMPVNGKDFNHEAWRNNLIKIAEQAGQAIADCFEEGEKK